MTSHWPGHIFCCLLTLYLLLFGSGEIVLTCSHFPLFCLSPVASFSYPEQHRNKFLILKTFSILFQFFSICVNGPATAHSWAHQWSWGTSVEVSVRKGKMLHGREEWERRWNSPLSTQVREGGEGGIALGAGASVFPAGHRESHTRAGADFSEGTAVHGEEPCQSRLLLKDSSLWRGPTMEQQKEAVTDWLQRPCSSLPVLPWTRRDREVGASKYEVESEERGQWEENVLF